MTQEEKNLLLQDLCARLPYKVMVNYGGYKGCDYVLSIKTLSDFPFYDLKPYLLPLSSMTEEQKREYDSIIYHNVELHCERYYNVIDVDDFENLMDFYHNYHLDYRGLIPMGLAIDATGKNIY